ncbi:MAG: hypothetical protein J6M31_08135 [Bacteroidales bacterium]|nr:hypothetical protein [Bacteroidales bacterium]
MRCAVKHIILWVLLAAAFTGCGLVDEDLRDCETDYTIDYELRLVTNMTTELQTQLSLAADITVSNALKTYLEGIFTDFAHDVDLGFYDVVEDSTRLHHETHIMDANQSSYTLYIPVRKYMHLALANLSGNERVRLQDTQRCHTAGLVQEVADTLFPHRSGIFTARLPMDVKEGQDQQFDVRLYIANCATALVVDTLGSHLKDIKVFLSGFATGFDVCDSVYHFSYTPVLRADELVLPASGTRCFASVNFPSREPSPSKAADHSLWQYKVYATLPDGKVTETILGLSKPLRAGELKVLKAKARENGQVYPGDPTVAVSVTLDWNPGLEIPVDI